MPDYRFACLSDTHHPIHDPRSIAWALDTIEAHIGTGDRSALVLSGDIFEGRATSRHHKDSRHNWTAVREFQAVGDFFKEINRRFPLAQKVWIFGNHDANFINYNTGRLDEDVQAIITQYWTDWCDGLIDGWIVKNDYRHDVNWNLGQVCFRHGVELSNAALTKDLIDYCPDYGLLVQGHTHRPQPVTQWKANGVLGRYWYCNTGNHMDVNKAHYMDRFRTSQWGNGVLIGEATASGLNEGRRSYTAPRWKAKLVVRAMGSKHYHDVGL